MNSDMADENEAGTSTLLYASAHQLFADSEAAARDMVSRPVNGEDSLAFMANLLESDTPEEAINFGAYLLPKRKAVWWGHECLRGLNHLLVEQDLAMLQLAENWVREPDEARRVQALTQASAVRNETPGVWIAYAAGWSGGSMATPDLPPVPPPPYLTPRAVSAGILGALAKVDLGHRATTLGVFVRMGIDLARR